MALLLFNSSIDPPAQSMRETAEELALNEQETIVELILEKMLDIDDAFSEHSDGDEDEHSGKLPTNGEWFLSTFQVDYSVYYDGRESQCLTAYEDQLPVGAKRRATPPPEV